MNFHEAELWMINKRQSSLHFNKRNIFLLCELGFRLKLTQSKLSACKQYYVAYVTSLTWIEQDDTKILVKKQKLIFHTHLHTVTFLIID